MQTEMKRVRDQSYEFTFCNTQEGKKKKEPSTRVKEANVVFRFDKEYIWKLGLNQDLWFSWDLSSDVKTFKML